METKTKGKRGRPAGSSNTTMIKDKVINPYMIYVEDNQFTLVKPKPDGNEETFGYYQTLCGCLQKISKLKTINNKVYSLSEYINSYNNYLKEFSKVFNI